MQWKPGQFSQRRITAPLSYGLLILILATDSLTPMGFAHGMLYAPVLLLAAFIARPRLLDIVFALSIVFVWLGLFLTLINSSQALTLNIYANRIFSSLILLVIYILSRVRLTHQKTFKLQQQQLHITASLAKLGHWQLDDNQQLVLSAEAAQILGLNQQPLPLQHFTKMLVEADGHHFLENIHTDKLPLDAEYRWRQNNDEIKWIRLVAYLNNQDQGEIHGVIQDIHTNRVVEAQVAEEERRFRYMADSMQLFAWTAQPDGNLDYVSKYTMDFLGANERFITENWLSYIHPDDQQPTMNRWAQSLKTGEPYLIEFRMRRHDGLYVWYLTRATPARDDQGNIFKWYGSGIDNSQSKLLQQHSERLSQQLQNTLTSITDAFFTLDKKMCFSY
ncbi:MAG TPA: PAS domain-containing protein, partial [Methylophaga sp.]|nr:PAS domain-containing protein [Methylophaga sp.]